MADGEGRMTICVECKWHHGHGNTWHNHRCTHPDTERRVGIDPVTGVMGHMAKNDLGRIYHSDDKADKYPYCRDMNDGSCKRFVIAS